MELEQVPPPAEDNHERLHEVGLVCEHGEIALVKQNVIHNALVAEGLEVASVFHAEAQTCHPVPPQGCLAHCLKQPNNPNPKLLLQIGLVLLSGR